MNCAVLTTVALRMSSGWKCGVYGHRTGDKECTMFSSGNSRLETFRYVRADPPHPLPPPLARLPQSLLVSVIPSWCMLLHVGFRYSLLVIPCQCPLFLVGLHYSLSNSVILCWSALFFAGPRYSPLVSVIPCLSLLFPCRSPLFLVSLHALFCLFPARSSSIDRLCLVIYLRASVYTFC